MEALQQLLAAHSQAVAWQSLAPPSTPPPAPSAFDIQLQLQLLSLAAQQQQNCPPASYGSPTYSSPGQLPLSQLPQRSSSLHLPSDRQPFRDLHAQVYGIKPPQVPVYSKPSTIPVARSSSGGGGGGGRWATPTDQRDVVITEQLALIKNLNETISQHKQIAVEQDAVRRALEASISELKSALSQSGSPPSSPGDSASPAAAGAAEEHQFTAEAQVAYFKEHAEQWSGRSIVDRQQLVQVLRTLIASNKRYQQPLPPMCVKPDCRCRNCWFLHAHIDETAWAAAWELHMSLR